MDTAQREFLDEKFAVKEWYGAGMSRGTVRGFRIEDLAFENWRMLSVKREDRPGTIALRSLWGLGNSMDDLLSVDVFECASAQAAHDQLLDMLADIQSPIVERQAGNPPGDFAFGLANSMILFARANLAIWIRNAGPKIVPVGGFARKLDEEILLQLKS